MQWSSYMGNMYAGVGWQCDFFDTCKSNQTNMGPRRWLCDACHTDICRLCHPYAGRLPNAFVAVLFGTKVSYCVEAAVLGQCLCNVGTKHQWILLHTHDVPKDWRDVLQDVAWRLQQVDYIDGDVLYDGSSKNRFKGIFTKLHAINLTQFEKVVLLDVDLLVLKNVDHLFNKKPPCTLRRQATGNLTRSHHKVRDATIW